MGHEPQRPDQLGGYTRRRLVGLGATATALGLSGCGGSPEEGTTPIGEGQPGTRTVSRAESTLRDPVVDTMVDWNWQPEEMNLNPFATAANAGSTHGGINVWREPEIVYSHGAQQHLPVLLEDLPTIEDCTVTYTYDDDYTWWDGTPVGADDRWMVYMLDSYMFNSTPEENEQTVERVDDQTVRVTKPRPLTDSIVNREEARRVRQLRHDYWEPTLERFRDSTTEDERVQIRRDVQEQTIGIRDFLDANLGTGLWKPESWSTTRMMQVKYEDHPEADRTNLSRWRYHIIADNQKFKQAFASDQLDAGRAVSDWKGDVQAPEGIDVLTEFALTGWPAVYPSWRNRHMANRGVRRAMAYLFDWEAIKRLVTEGFGKPVQACRNVQGMQGAQARRWLGQDFLDRLIDYGQTAQPERAGAMMRQSGYEKRNGVWVDGDGNRTQGISFIAPPFGPWPLVGNTIADWLSSFGIKLDYVTPEVGTWSKIWYDTFDFDLIMGPMGGGGVHPSSFYNFGANSGFGPYLDPQTVTRWPSPEGCSREILQPEFADGVSRSPRLRHPIDPSPKFPSEVGAMEISGEGQRFKPFEWVGGLQVARTDEEATQIARKCAQYFNYQVYSLPTFISVNSSWGDTGDFEFPSEDNPHVKRQAAHIALLKRGLVSGREK